MSSAPRPIRIGIVGCGQIAQIMHLPHLRQLDELFQLTALCDVSPGVLAYCGERWHVEPAQRYASTEAMVERAGLDAVLVCDVLHSDASVTALNAGCHVLVEKPMAHSLQECDRMLEAAAKSGKTLMMAYMKRFDPAYEYAQARVAKRSDVFHVRAHDFVGPNGAFTGDIHRTAVFKDIPPGNDAREVMRKRMSQALEGRSEPVAGHMYGTLLGLCTHDLTILRGMFGSPKRVKSALYGRGGRTFHALLDYGDQITGVFEYANLKLKKFDEVLSIYADSEVIHVKFPSPYVPFAPTVVELWEPDGPGKADRPDAPDLPDGPAGQGFKESFVMPSLDEAFRRELQHFAHCVRTGAKPRTTPEDGREDVRMCIEMTKAALQG
ncbi:MAG: Gfo/Idh/MocA family oxidoreductase [Planctomycetes bacterium]|nr:Gfo/Idh/MocA family oxidoreductase [Planctomycetota bacterium]